MAERLPVLLLPGMACDERVWDRRITRELERRAEARHVNALVGRSVPEMAEHVLAHAPERFAVCGFSQGGIVALEIAARAPDRVLGVAVIACSARAPTPAQTSLWAVLDGYAREGDIDAAVDTLLPALLRADAPAPIRALVRVMAHSVGAALLRDQLAAQRSRPDRRAALTGISCPAVAVAARDDAACPVEGVEEIAESIPGAQLGLVADAGHLATLTQPRAVALHLAEWIDRCEP